MEKLAVVEGGHLVESLDRQRLAADGDDGVGGDLGALAGAVRASAIDGERLAADLPGNALLGVVPNRLLPGDPAVRDPVLVERQDERKAAHRLVEFACEIVHLTKGAHVPLQFTKFLLLVLAHNMRRP
jgi:hypothetical protein